MSHRITSLDVTRGLAVMGILLMNAGRFAQPEGAYLWPSAWRPQWRFDDFLWALQYLFVDSKMRALFTMLFGASALLVMERAGPVAARWTHWQRMVTLLLFGAVHQYLIWVGDILSLYALLGFTLPFVAHWPARKLAAAGATLLILSVVMIGPAMWFVANYDATAFLRSLAASDQAATAERAAMLGSFADGLRWRIADSSDWPIGSLVTGGPETLAMMWVGMALYRSGLWRGRWSPQDERRALAQTLGVGLAGNALLLAWQWTGGGPEPMRVMLASIAWSVPFDLLTAMGYALLAARWSRGGGVAVSRVAAAGRAAFSNYLGTSLIMLPLMGGWGAGLFGSLSRAQALLLALAICALMLLWSKPWLDRFNYGPFEWLWRMLARGRRVPLRR